MSRIYFHSPSDTVEVLGSERAWLGWMTDHIGSSMLSGSAVRDIAKWATVNLYGKTVDEYRFDQELMQAASTAFTGLTARMGGRTLSYGDIDLDTWIIGLDTAMRLGSPAVQLAVRIHAQCEMHGWVDGPNRAWLAGIIQDGLQAGVFRKPWGGRDTGWTGVAEFLRATDSEPVVMSSSNADQFPNPGASAWKPPDDYDGEPSDAWYDLPDDEAWRLGMDYLKAHPGQLELQPDGFADYVFGDHGGLNWLDLIAGEARTREVLELEALP